MNIEAITGLERSEQPVIVLLNEAEAAAFEMRLILLCWTWPYGLFTYPADVTIQEWTWEWVPVTLLFCFFRCLVPMTTRFL